MSAELDYAKETSINKNLSQTLYHKLKQSQPDLRSIDN